jgi:hypothetical protein
VTSVIDRDAVAVVEALGVLPETFWNHEDDACDCTFQRIGMWKNPYIGETLEVRMCCIWAELYKLFPQHVRVTPGYLVDDAGWDTSIREWDGESNMPRSIFYRQMARKDGISLAEARQRYAHLEPPKGTPLPVAESGPSLVTLLYAQVVNLKRRLEALEAK